LNFARCIRWREENSIEIMTEPISKPQRVQTAAHDRVLRNVCVYCGSSPGADPIYEAAARKLGHLLAKESIGLVYGGGSRGLMGVVAQSVLADGGTVTGIIPSFLTEREGMIDAVQTNLIVPDMHTRKRIMFERADAFVALPGGIGTLEELVEQLSWVQLGRHTKPVVIADIGGFWRPLLDLFAHMRGHGFIQASLEVRYLVAERVEDILPMIESALVKSRALGKAKETLDRPL
jgi:uncharacterized protein (TIGR00730 family)